MRAFPTAIHPQCIEWLETQRNFCKTLASESTDEYEKSEFPPANDLFVEWTYTYDLDNLAFVVDSKAFFSLSAIAQKPADEWIPSVSLDARGKRCLSLDTPRSLIAKPVRTQVPFLGGDPVPAVDEFVSTSAISPSTWSQPLTPHHRRLMLAQVNASIAEAYSKLSIFPRYSTSELDVQNAAMSFLEAIVPNNQAIVANRRSPTLPHTQPAARHGCPWFWYRRCLILLANDLDNNELFRVYVQAVAAKAKAKNLDRCTALLWSVHYVAVVEITGGSMSHSDPIPLLAAYGSDEEGFMNALYLLWHYLPYPRWRIATSHGAGILDFCGFPTEIVMKIMEFTDQLHYPKYQLLSRSFFKLWWDHPRIASYTILRDAEEIEDTFLYFNAHSANENAPVKLRLKFLWGKKTGNFWRSESVGDDSPSRTDWGRPIQGGDNLDFSRGSPETKYRVQRFYSYWPEGLVKGDTLRWFFEHTNQDSRGWQDLLARTYNPPGVSDPYSSRTDILLCEVKPF